MLHYFRAESDSHQVTHKPHRLIVSCRKAGVRGVQKYSILVKISETRIKRRANLIQDLENVWLDSDGQDDVHLMEGTTNCDTPLEMNLVPGSSDMGFLIFVETKGGKSQGRKKQRYLLLTRLAVYSLSCTEPTMRVTKVAMQFKDGTVMNLSNWNDEEHKQVHQYKLKQTPQEYALANMKKIQARLRKRKQQLNKTGKSTNKRSSKRRRVSKENKQEDLSSVSHSAAAQPFVFSSSCIPSTNRASPPATSSIEPTGFKHAQTSSVSQSQSNTLFQYSSKNFSSESASSLSESDSPVALPPLLLPVSCDLNLIAQSPLSFDSMESYSDASASTDSEPNSPMPMLDTCYKPFNFSSSVPSTSNNMFDAYAATTPMGKFGAEPVWSKHASISGFAISDIDENSTLMSHALSPLPCISMSSFSQYYECF